MRASFLVALALTMCLAGAQWYQSTKYICPVPIPYRLGVIDDSFGITAAQAQGAILEAENMWEEAVAEDLFVFDDEADFTINFLFDERQETANAQTQDRERLDAIAASNEDFKNRIDSLQNVYESQQADFERDRAEYEAQLRAYNQRVQQANDRGGARPETFAQLESERLELERSAAGLERDANELNELAGQLNALSTEGNQLIEQYNAEVQEYNDQYGEAHEFTQGDYRGGEINVYKFSNNNELVAVLAHEFGHALGIEHIEDEGALMYYLLDDDLSSAPIVTPADIAAFEAVCHEQGIGGHIRGFIRSIIS